MKTSKIFNKRKNLLALVIVLVPFTRLLSQTIPPKISDFEAQDSIMQARSNYFVRAR